MTSSIVWRVTGDNIVPCSGNAPFWDLPPPRTFPYDHFRDHDDWPSYLCWTTLKGPETLNYLFMVQGWYPPTKILDPLRDQEGCLELSDEIPRRC